MNVRATRDARPEDLPVVSQALARSFHDDPVFEFMIPDEARRERVLPSFFGVFCRHHVRRGDTVHVTGGCEAGALWSPPGRWKTGSVELVRLGLPMTRILGRRLPTSLAALSAVEKVHPEEPHWYLGVLGTDTRHQGKGHGGDAMAPVLARCDGEGVPAYLESSKERNIPFYERHGFKVTGEIRFGKKGPLVWPMWREPQPD